MMRVFVSKIQRLFPRNGVCLALCCWVVLFTGCAAVPEEEFVDAAPAKDVLQIMPYTLDELGRMLIDVQINGKGPFKFIIDSAASRTLIYENLRRQLDIKFIAGETTFVHGAVINERRPILPLRMLGVGSLELYDVRSFSLPDPIVTKGPLPKGILGLDFLSQYAMYVNVEEQRIVFANSGYRPSVNQYVSVPIVFDDLGIIEYGLPIIQVKVQNKNMDALLDLGAAQTIANWSAADLFGVNIRRFLRNRYDFKGVFSSIPLRARADSATVTIGKRVWKNQKIDIANLKIFETLNRKNVPAIIVSAGLLREEDYIIDFPAALFYLRANSTQRLRGLIERCTVDPNGVILCGNASGAQ